MESSNAESQFPRDLQTVNDILDVNFLIDDLTSEPDNPVPLSVVSAYITICFVNCRMQCKVIASRLLGKL